MRNAVEELQYLDLEKINSPFEINRKGYFKFFIVAILSDFCLFATDRILCHLKTKVRKYLVVIL